MTAIPRIQHWHPTARPPCFPAAGLHLWRIRTGDEGAPLPAQWPLLSPRESARARRLRLEAHRERYVRAHAGLRRILSTYLRVSPQDVAFAIERHGKPRIDGGGSGLEFNLTTSGELALLAVSESQPVGVDCERVRERRNLDAIARRMLTPGERSRIAAAAPHERLERFHLAWTALEAGVKEDGRGLSRRGERTARGALQIAHCVPEPGFIAAVARLALPPVREWVTMELTAD